MTNSGAIFRIQGHKCSSNSTSEKYFFLAAPFPELPKRQVARYKCPDCDRIHIPGASDYNGQENTDRVLWRNTSELHQPCLQHQQPCRRYPSYPLPCHHGSSQRIPYNHEHSHNHLNVNPYYTMYGRISENPVDINDIEKLSEQGSYIGINSFLERQPKYSNNTFHSGKRHNRFNENFNGTMEI